MFNLHDGGQIRGELVNRDESPRKSYVIKTASGGRVTLEAEQVKSVHRQNAAEMQYDRIRSSYPDTLDGQWKLAEWCRENRLPTQRKVHLERIIELDPDHVKARHALGYANVQGRWARQETLMTENGYVQLQGSMGAAARTGNPRSPAQGATGAGRVDAQTEALAQPARFR